MYSQRKKLRPKKTYKSNEPGSMPAETTASDDEEAENKPNNNIYLNEDLTKRRATILCGAPKLVKGKQTKAWWSLGGKIMVGE